MKPHLNQFIKLSQRYVTWAASVGLPEKTHHYLRGETAADPFPKHGDTIVVYFSDEYYSVRYGSFPERLTCYEHSVTMDTGFFAFRPHELRAMVESAEHYLENELPQIELDIAKETRSKIEHEIRELERKSSLLKQKLNKEKHGKVTDHRSDGTLHPENG